MPVTREQFDELLKEGLTVEEIADFDKKTSTQQPVQITPQTTQQNQQRPSILSQLVRFVMRGSPIEQLKTATYAYENQDKIPTPQEGQSLEDYAKSYQSALQPREQQIAQKGTMAQFEEPIIGGMTISGAQVPVQLLEGLLKFGALEGVSQITGLNKAIQNIQQPELRDVADIVKVGAEGVFASQRWIPGKVSNQFKTTFKNLIENPTTELKLKEFQYQKQDLNKNIKDSIDLMKESQHSVKNEMIKDIQKTSTNLDKVAQQDAIKVQEELPKFFRKNSDSYGKNIDSISDKLSSNMEYITKGEINDLLGKTELDIYDTGITTGQPLELFNRLRSKYRSDLASNMGNSGWAERNKEINFSDFIREYRQIRDALSTQAKSGIKFSEEDVVSAVFTDNVGNWISERVPEFKQLQQAYKPIVQTMKAAGKLFKPYGNKFENISGVNLLKRYGMGKSSPQELDLIKILENGSEFAPGIGKITANAEKIGYDLQLKQSFLKNLSSTYKQVEFNLRNINKPKIEDIVKQERQLTIRKLMDDKRKKIIQNLLYIAGGIAGVEAIKKGKHLVDSFK